MKVVERHLISKTGDPATCEDGIAVSEHFAAVVDGATDKSGRRFEDMTGGRFLMLVVCGLLRTLPADIDALTAVHTITAGIAARLPPGLGVGHRPEASTVIYSRARRQVWSVGDCGFWHDGLATARPGKYVDEVASAMRAAVITAHLLSGRAPADQAETDPGRDAILPVLTRQNVFANNPEAGPFAYGVLNGLPVPDHLVAIHPVPPDIGELVLASDGFPELHPTLAATRTRLAELLADDPLCIGALRSTKGMRQGAVNFDDTAYLRLAL